MPTPLLRRELAVPRVTVRDRLFAYSLPDKTPAGARVLGSQVAAARNRFPSHRSSGSAAARAPVRPSTFQIVPGASALVRAELTCHPLGLGVALSQTLGNIHAEAEHIRSRCWEPPRHCPAP
jgi:hypothetical protein